jgi:hypothetical protein
MTEQLYQLARRFPPSMIESKPGKYAASFVSHGNVTARLLEVLGPFDWSIAKIITNAEGIAVGCIGRLEVVVDGRPVVIEEVGDCEPVSPNSASNLMTASSTAIKRAAMRLGLGLHLWAGDDRYYLDRSLERRRASESVDDLPVGEDTDEPAIAPDTAAQDAIEDISW